MLNAFLIDNNLQSKSKTKIELFVELYFQLLELESIMDENTCRPQLDQPTNSTLSFALESANSTYFDK